MHVHGRISTSRNSFLLTCSSDKKLTSIFSHSAHVRVLRSLTTHTNLGSPGNSNASPNPYRNVDDKRNNESPKHLYLTWRRWPCCPDRKNAVIFEVFVIKNCVVCFDVLFTFKYEKTEQESKNYVIYINTVQSMI